MSAIKGIVVATLCFVGIASSASLKKIGIRENFEKNGFTFLGRMSQDKNATNVGVSAVETQSISLFLSPHNDKETQVGALQKCRSYYGDLLFMLNERQFRDVEMATLGIGEPFWSSAMYDEAQGAFAWFPFNLKVEKFFMKIEGACNQQNTHMGLTVQGSMSTYGMCSATTSSRFRYICRV